MTTPISGSSRQALMASINSVSVSGRKAWRISYQAHRQSAVRVCATWGVEHEERAGLPYQLHASSVPIRQSYYASAGCVMPPALQLVVCAGWQTVAAFPNDQ